MFPTPLLSPAEVYNCTVGVIWKKCSLNGFEVSSFLEINRYWEHPEVATCVVCIYYKFWRDNVYCFVLTGSNTQERDVTTSPLPDVTSLQSTSDPTPEPHRRSSSRGPWPRRCHVNSLLQSARLKLLVFSTASRWPQLSAETRRRFHDE